MRHRYADPARRRLRTQWQALVAADPATTASFIGQRLGHIYAIVNQAWTGRDLSPRAVLSDGLDCATPQPR